MKSNEMQPDRYKYDNISQWTNVKTRGLRHISYLRLLRRLLFLCISQEILTTRSLVIWKTISLCQCPRRLISCKKEKQMESAKIYCQVFPVFCS
jgi:hypothetical protein